MTLKVKKAPLISEDTDPMEGEKWPSVSKIDP